MYISQAEFHKTHGHDDAVEYIPADLEVVVWVHRYEFEDHLSCEDAREHLERHAPSLVGFIRGQFRRRKPNKPVKYRVGLYLVPYQIPNRQHMFELRSHGIMFHGHKHRV